MTEESWREKLPIYDLAPSLRRCNATQRNTTQPGAISGGAANIGGKTAFEPRRLPEEILSAGDISVCGRDLRAALPHYLLWLPVLHFLPLPLLPLILNSAAAAGPPPPTTTTTTSSSAPLVKNIRPILNKLLTHRWDISPGQTELGGLQRHR